MKPGNTNPHISPEAVTAELKRLFPDIVPEDRNAQYEMAGWPTTPGAWDLDLGHYHLTVIIHRDEPLIGLELTKGETFDDADVASVAHGEVSSVGAIEPWVREKVVPKVEETLRELERQVEVYRQFCAPLSWATVGLPRPIFEPTTCPVCKRLTSYGMGHKIEGRGTFCSKTCAYAEPSV